MITLEECCKTNCVAFAIKALRYYIKTDKAFNKKENLKILLAFCKFSKDFFSSVSDSDSIIKVIENFNINFNNFTFKQFFISYLKKEDVESTDLLEYPLEDSEKDYDKKTNKLLTDITYVTGKKLVKEIFSENSKYITTYQAKGAEFNSVFVALRPTSTESKIINMINILSNPDTEKEEFCRILYVACTRAINKLYVYITCSQSEAQKILTNLEKWKSDKKITTDFYEPLYL